ncbi:hypothetical protein SPD48_09445 [Pseudogracilibacillus sp. SE30717A]|uniref:hypothetical protein n=1 Tax=Pseudogracilibacillus sp. SE30717A TaxID=3098293 RepID=UPI00300DD5C1
MDATISNISPIRENGEVTSIKVEFNASLKGGEINISGSLVIGDLDSVINFEEIHQRIKQKLASEVIGE